MCTQIDDHLRLTAYHEAGHAVMAELCGQHVTEVEIVRDHAENLMRMNWSAVETLAGALMDRRRMSGEEVRRLLTPLLPQ